MAGRAATADATSHADSIEREVLARISPDPTQLGRVAEVRTLLVDRADAAARELGIPIVRSLVAGSAARGTFVKDRLDLDFFLLFPTETSRERLEKDGLALARAVLESGETRYAEHPYLRGTFEGFTVDAVPGYAVTDASHPLSAVDRTPFHQEYLERHLTPERVAQIRLTKQFLRGLGVYGAEARTGGFSGYLVELLVLRFGSLRALLLAGRDWRIPVDLHSPVATDLKVPEDVSVILDDPVDPHRNVASALTRRNLGLFIVAAGEYLARPRIESFTVAPPVRLSRAESLGRIAERGTHVAILTVRRPMVVDDILYPQLRKAERAIAEEVERHGFRVLGTASAAGERSVVLALEVAGRRIPAVKLQRGPPAGIDRVGEFLGKWGRSEAPVLQGPYMTADGRLAVEVKQPERELEAVLASAISRLPLGRDLKMMVEPATQPRSLEEVEDSPELAVALGELLDKRLPWLRARTG